MAEYYSRYVQNIDIKGRIVLPGKLRRVAEEECGLAGKKGKKINFYMKFFDGGLALFTEATWRPLRKHYMGLKMVDEKDRKEKREFFFDVEEVPCDRQGRMNIPKLWRDRAALTDKVVIIGVGDHIELWNEVRFKKQESQDWDTFDNEAADDE